ncbi:MAG: CoA transferase [Betaproteobacteria bacterium]|nr:CoA transferase [Betaproteobacteria bacterium]
MTSGGPLQGLRVLEFAALGPAPLGAMLLADLGAQVLSIERAAPPGRGAQAVFEPELDVLRRNRQVLRLDLKQARDLRVARRLAEGAEVLIEGLRPGVMERLGLGPEDCLRSNPRLVYARMTGWGQHGPLAASAGHDINYLALSGMLHAIGEPGGKPVVPLNLVADGGAGGMMLAFGVLAALTHARATGQGQVVDTAMAEGCALLGSMIHTLRAMGSWNGRRGDNLLDGGAYFYATYACADGRHVAVGAIEPEFHERLLRGLGLDPAEFEGQHERALWPQRRQRLAAVFATRSREAWCELFAGSEACVSPVLDFDEAPRHPHHAARGAFVDLGGVRQAAPAPRFGATPAPLPRRPVQADAAALRAWGLDAALAAELGAELGAEPRPDPGVRGT